jgi:hypothetical protein
MEYREIMHEAARVFNERNPKYGDMRVGMERVAHIATLITGIQLTAHDVALVLHAVKLSRLGADRRNPDHYVDGVNYLAFAGELIEGPAIDPEIAEALNAMNNEFAKMAESFSVSNPNAVPQEG